MADLSAIKAAARKAAFERRKVAKANGGDATEPLLAAIEGLAGDVVSGYWPIRTEIDPRAALRQLAATRRIVLPVVEAPRQPLAFRFWQPGAKMIPGTFGAAIPAETHGADPQILIVPLLAFDARGFRLGYGGGFYDRTLERLRARGPCCAIGFAFAAQEVETVPTDSTDQPLDMIVTEAGTRVFG